MKLISKRSRGGAGRGWADSTPASPPSGALTPSSPPPRVGSSGRGRKEPPRPEVGVRKTESRGEPDVKEEKTNSGGGRVREVKQKEDTSGGHRTQTAPPPTP